MKVDFEFKIIATFNRLYQKSTDGKEPLKDTRSHRDSYYGAHLSLEGLRFQITHLLVGA